MECLHRTKEVSHCLHSGLRMKADQVLPSIRSPYSSPYLTILHAPSIEYYTTKYFFA
jgi:hypothetical protein